MSATDPEALMGGGAVGVLVVLVRDLIGRLVPSSAPGAAEVQLFRERVLTLEHQLGALQILVKNEADGRQRMQERLDDAASQINRATGAIHAMHGLLVAPEERHDAGPRRRS